MTASVALHTRCSEIAFWLWNCGAGFVMLVFQHSSSKEGYIGLAASQDTLRMSQSEVASCSRCFNFRTASLRLRPMEKELGGNLKLAWWFNIRFSQFHWWCRLYTPFDERRHLLKCVVIFIFINLLLLREIGQRRVTALLLGEKTLLPSFLFRRLWHLHNSLILSQSLAVPSGSACILSLLSTLPLRKRSSCSFFFEIPYAGMHTIF